MAVTEILPPPALIVIAPKETNTVDRPPLLLTVRLLAVINPEETICAKVLVAETLTLVSVTAPPLIAPVLFMPLPPDVVLVLTVIACPVAVRVPSALE